MTTRPRRTTTGRFRLAGSLLALALLAAACGDDDSDEAAETTTTTEAEPTGGDTDDDAAGGGLIGDDFAAGEWQGVTDDTIRIGVPWLFLGDAAVEDPSFSLFHGRITDHFDAALARYREEGRLPAHGRDIEIVSMSYSAAPEEQRAACVALVQDEQVAFVTASFLFPVGFECVAAENSVPVLLSDSTTEAILDRSFPFGFANGASQERLLRNLPNWADSAGLLADDAGESSVVGIYRSDDPTTAELMQETFVAQLVELGHPEPVVATFAEAEDPATADLAVQQFLAADVDIVLLTDDRANFLQAASTQGAQWDYLDSDFQFGTTDSGTQGYPADQYERVQAMTVRHGGEPASGLGRTPEQQECADGYQDYTAGLAAEDDYYPAEGWQPEDNTFHLQSLYHACDLMETTISMLEAVGPNLTGETVVAGYESLGGPIEWARTLQGGFSTDQHHGADFFRILSWAAECPGDAGNLTSCFYIDEQNVEPQPFFVP